MRSSVFRGVTDDRAQRRHIVGLDTTAERVGHEVLGEGHQEGVFVLEQRAAQAGGAFHLGAVVELPRRVDRDAVVLDPQPADDVEVLEREAERIDHAMTRDARRIRAVLLHPLAHGEEPPLRGGFRILERRHVRRRRRRGSAEQHLQHPLATLHRRRPVRDRGEQKNAPLGQEAAARLGQQRASELRAGDVGQPVMPREPLVHEGVVGGDEVKDAAILADDAVEEELGFADERFGERAVPVRVEQPVGPDLVDVLQPQPLRRKSRRQRLRSRVGQHALDLPVVDRRIAQRAVAGGLEQFLIRQGRPEEERQARGEVEIGQTIELVGRRRGLLDTEHEAGVREDPLDAEPDSLIEIAAVVARLRVEPEEVVEVVAHRTAVGLRREPPQDVGRAAALLGRGRRAAREDPLTARRLGHAGHVRRPGNRDLLQVRRHRDAVAGADARVDQRLIDRREQVVDRPDRSGHERRGDSLRPGLDGDRRRLERQPLLAGVVHRLIDFEHRGSRAVDGDLEQLLLSRHVDRRVAEQLAADGPDQRGVKPIEAVGRERVHERRAAARSERRALDELHLILGRQHPVRRRRRRRRTIADREAADLTGRAQVALWQGR